MTRMNSAELLEPDEPPPVSIVNSEGQSPFLLIGDHAGNRIPRKLGTLELSETDRFLHIAWDIGTQALGELLAVSLDAPFISQRYSRLVVDCNRDPASPELVPAISDGTRIPGNEHLSAIEGISRTNAIHKPYQDCIGSILARHAECQRPTILLSLHSFTPVMNGQHRPWHIGILHSEGETGFARTLLGHLRHSDDIIVGDNEPYEMDETDYTVPRHAFSGCLPYAEIEIRQDLIADETGQRLWAEKLRSVLKSATG